MINLLMHLSWFIFAMSLVLVFTALSSLVLRKKKKSGASMCCALTSLGVSSVAFFALILATGYLTMLSRLTSDYGAPCRATNKSESGELGQPGRNTKVLMLSWYWSAFTGKYPALEIWARWFSLGLCFCAIVSFFIVLRLVSISKNDELSRKRKMNIEFLKKLIEKRTPYNKMEPKISCINKDVFAAKPRTTKPKSSHEDLLVILAAIGLFCATFIGLKILNHHSAYELPAPGPCDCGTQGSSKSSIGPPYIVPRGEWMAEDVMPVTALSVPVGTVVISHTERGSCFSIDECANALRQIQICEPNCPNGTANGVSDNFVVGGDGRIYEGRGWDYSSDDFGFNDSEILTVLFVGVRTNQLPRPRHLKAFNHLILEGLKSEKLAHDYELVANPKTKKSLLFKFLKNFNDPARFNF